MPDAISRLHLIRRFPELGVAILAIGLVIAPRLGAQEPRTASVLVAVAGADGEAVKNLGADDFRVLIDGRSQALVAVRSASGIPISLVAIVDASKSDVLPIKASLNAMAAALAQANPSNRIGVVEFKNPPVTFQAAGAGPEAFNRMFSSWTGFAYETLPGIVEAAKALQHEDARRIVLVIRDRSGIRDNDPTTPKKAADALYAANASLWAVFLRASNDPTAGTSLADLALTDVPALSGGMSSQVLSPTAFEASTRRLVDLVLSQYVLTYSPVDVSAKSQIHIAVRQPKATILAPHWMR